MPRKKTPSYVVTLPLATVPADERRLEATLEAAKRLNNVILQDGLRIVDAVRSDPRWALARKLPRSTKEQCIARSEAFGAVRAAYGFSEFSFHEQMKVHRNASGLGDRVGAHPAQKLATKVFQALEQYLLGKRGRPRFKGVKRPLHSIEGKNQAGKCLVWDKDAGRLHLNKDWSIAVSLPDLGKDEWLWSALQAPTKYCRLVWHSVGKERRWSVQLVQEGVVPLKASLAARLLEARKGEGARAAIDIGPSNLAWCTETDAGVFRFCAEVEQPAQQIRRLQRQLDRQRRANNPENFDEKGRARRGRTWVKSARQQDVEARLRRLQTYTAARRANAHGRDINTLLSKAAHIRHDGVSVRSLQRNYGVSVGTRAPGRFMSELERKAERAGGASIAVNVRQLKTSQYDHSTGVFRKKTLSERWHFFADGRGRVQRDVYSAFLALHASVTPAAEGAKEDWSYDPAQLEAAWVVREPALRARKLFVSNESLCMSEGSSICPPRDACTWENCKPDAVRRPAGARARGAVRVGKNPDAQV